MTRTRKLLISALVVGTLGSVAALGVFGAFSATTQNAGNEIVTGNVVLTDNDAGQALFNIQGAAPGDSWTRCIKVSYNGTLPASVHLYQLNSSGPLATYLDLSMAQGTQSSATFPDCTGFAPDATGTIFSGPAYGPSGSYDFGLPVVPAGQTVWEPGDSLVFKMILTLDPAAPNTAQASSSGNQTIVWEAHSD